MFLAPDACLLGIPVEVDTRGFEERPDLVHLDCPTLVDEIDEGVCRSREPWLIVEIAEFCGRNPELVMQSRFGVEFRPA